MSGALPTGTVFGTLLNFRGELQALGEQVNGPPYGAPPKAPVLYIKSANTFSADGASIALPAGVESVEVGATVAMVMQSGTEVAGYRLMNDLSLPHASLFRPPVKFKCLDGFLGVGAQLPAAAGADPARFVLEVRINGELRQAVDFVGLVRPPARLLADVGEFMTLRAGDLLMLGCDVPPAGHRPLARAGDRIEIRAEGLGVLTNTLVQEAV